MTKNSNILLAYIIAFTSFVINTRVTNAFFLSSPGRNNCHREAHAHDIPTRRLSYLFFYSSRVHSSANGIKKILPCCLRCPSIKNRHSPHTHLSTSTFSSENEEDGDLTNKSSPSNDTAALAPMFDGQTILPSSVVLERLKGYKVAAVYAVQHTEQSGYGAVKHISVTQNFYRHLRSLMKKYPGHVEFIRALSFPYPQTSVMRNVAKKWKVMVLGEGGKLGWDEEERFQVGKEPLFFSNTKSDDEYRRQKFSSTVPLSSSSSSPLTWFILLDSDTGEFYRGTSADCVLLAAGSVIAQFRDAVKLKHSNKLVTIDSADLLVYRNKESFDKRNDPNGNEEDSPFRSSHQIYGLGGTEEDALVVVVPSLALAQSATSQSTLGKASEPHPHPKRKERWIKINKILESNAKKMKTNDSTGYSYVTWEQYQYIFSPKKYVQTRKDIDKEHLDFIQKYLSYTTQCFGNITTGKEAKRLHFIAPILICVCFLFKGSVDIAVEENLDGKFVKAHGHFEFMIRRGGKAVCIVEAKRDDFEQGMAQDLVGCEVAAEVGGLDIVYGIVTNYIQWNLLRSGNEKIELDECSLRLKSDGPDLESLKEIVEKIYAMLSDD
jgi:hypothetical protein